jgi:hypothetical protein
MFIILLSWQKSFTITFLGGMELLDTNQLKEYLAISDKHLKPASLAHRIRFMKSFFRWSHEEDYLSKNPTSKIKEPKVGKWIPKYLTEREIQHLRNPISGTCAWTNQLIHYNCLIIELKSDKLENVCFFCVFIQMCELFVFSRRTGTVHYFKYHTHSIFAIAVVPVKHPLVK